jgi:hypothetical protein
MAERVHIVCGEFLTGQILSDVPTTEGGNSWSTVLNDGGEVEATIPLRSQRASTRQALLSYVEPWRCYLAAVTDSGQVLEAGPIISHAYDDNTGHLTVGVPLIEHRKRRARARLGAPVAAPPPRGGSDSTFLPGEESSPLRGGGGGGGGPPGGGGGGPPRGSWRPTGSPTSGSTSESCQDHVPVYGLQGLTTLRAAGVVRVSWPYTGTRA